MSLEDRLYPLLSLYERLPHGLKRAVGGAYRRLPQRWRMGARFSEFERLTREGEAWTADQARQYQWAQLRQVLQHAAAFCPYYQKTFARAGFRPESMGGPEDLRRAPLLEKKDLQKHLAELASTAWPARARLYITTGGSTGTPVGFYLQQ